MKGYFGQLAAVVWKDLVVELRTKERIVAMGGFTVLVGVLFNYGLDRSIVRPQDVAAGWIWVTIVFTGMMGLGRTFELERSEGALRGRTSESGCGASACRITGASYGRRAYW